MSQNRSLEDDISAVRRETAALLDSVRSLDAASLTGPSLCTGWTRGHVLSHVARNADALGNLARAALTGEPIPMYASAEARDGDIEAGAGRPLDAQRRDLQEGAGRWDADMSRLLADADRLATVTVEARNHVMVRALGLPFMRLREVAYHHVDLDTGFGFADLEPATQGALLAHQATRVAGQADAPSFTLSASEGDELTVGDDPAYVIRGARSALLGWISRGLTDGVTSTTKDGTPAFPTLPFGG